MIKAILVYQINDIQIPKLWGFFEHIKNHSNHIQTLSHYKAVMERSASTEEKTEKARILVIEDEDDISRLLMFNLELEGFQVEIVKCGNQAMDQLRNFKPHLILLDLMLPGMDGLTLCRKMKGSEEAAKIPIIILTAKSDEKDVILGLNLGADDYITKPFSPKILVARVNTILRRIENSQVTETIIEVGRLTIDTVRYEAKIDGAKADLTLSEFHILKLLASKPGWVYSRSQIIDAIRGDNYAVTERSIDFQIVGLRKKLGPISSVVETVRGVGYRFKQTTDNES
jgi:two-component system phosphate regulon response regulator PhoB